MTAFLRGRRLEDWRGYDLTKAEQDRADVIEQESSQRLADGYADVTIQTMISAWVDQVKQSSEFFRGEKGDVISEAAFGRLEGEMSYDEVRAIIGRDGERTVRSNSSIDGARMTSAQYLWSWDLKPGTIARIQAFFLNDELRVKAYDEVPD